MVYDTSRCKAEESNALPGFGTFFNDNEEIEKGDDSLEFPPSARLLFRVDDAAEGGSRVGDGAGLSLGSREDERDEKRSRCAVWLDAFIRERA